MGRWMVETGLTEVKPVKQLIIREGSLLYRWFDWSLRTIEYARWGPDKIDYRQVTNLCHMMRVLLVWAPLAILWNLIAIGVFVFTFFVWPYQRLGLHAWAGYMIIYLWAILVVLVVNWWARRPTKGQIESLESTSTTSTTLTIVHLIAEAIVAWKQKICPLIVFSRGEKQ
jgi:hypothetical protein